MARFRRRGREMIWRKIRRRKALGRIRMRVEKAKEEQEMKNEPEQDQEDVQKKGN